MKPGTYDPVAKYEVNRYEGTDWVIETYLIPAEWVTGEVAPGEDSHFVVFRSKDVADKDFREIVMDGDEFEALAKFLKMEAKNNRNRIWTVEPKEPAPVPDQRPGTVLE